MENAVDALKMVLGILVFIIGLTMLFSMASQARETSRILISEIDKTKYYDYYDSADSGKIDNNGNRIVKIQDIVPVLYRYSQENYGVTIVDKSGNIVTRFDLDTERICNSWADERPYTKYKFITETKNFYIQVNSLANKIGKKQINLTDINSEEMTALFKRIYGQNKSGAIRRDFYCSWITTGDWPAKRIDSDLSRYRCHI